jgi:hypothetical protein
VTDYLGCWALNDNLTSIGLKPHKKHSTYMQLPVPSKKIMIKYVYILDRKKFYYLLFLLLIIGIGILLTTPYAQIVIWGLFGTGVLIFTFLYPIIGIFGILLAEITLVGIDENISYGKIFVFCFLLYIIVVSIYNYTRNNEIISEKWYKPLIFFYIVCLISIIPATMSNVSVSAWLREFFPLLNYSLIFVSFVIIDNQKKFLKLFIFMCFLLVCLLFREFLFTFRDFSILNSISPFYTILIRFFRAPGTPLVYTLVIFFCLTFFSKKHRLLSNTFMLILGFIAFFTLLFSGTRTYWIGFILGIMVWQIFLLISGPKKWKKMVPRTFFAIILIIGSFFPLVNSSIHNSVSNSTDSIVSRAHSLSINNLRFDVSVESRYQESIAALISYRDSPLIGRGLGYELISNVNFWKSSEITRGYLHNSFLYFLLKLGPLGLMAFFWLLLSIIHSLIDILRKSVLQKNAVLIHSLVLALFISLIFLVFVSFTTSKLNDTPTTLIFSIALGSIIRFSRELGIR